MQVETDEHALAGAFTRQKHLDRFLVHLRQQCTARNLNLVIGAGATVDAGAPLWGELIGRLRANMTALTGLKEDHLGSFGHTMAASVLLKWLEARIKHDHDYRKHHVPDCDTGNYVRNRWNNLIRDAIYRKVPPEVAKRVKRHTYLEALAHLVASCPLTINFNFDDIVDTATQAVCESKSMELPHIVWRLPFGYQHRGATILHINGLLSSTGKSHSEQLVLTEGAFAELMMQQTDYQSITLLRAFAESTILIIGSSMDDTSLKAILRSSRQINQANYHYIIHFLHDDDTQTNEHLQRMFEVNRDIYNLITIFLRRGEYRAFLELIAQKDPSEFQVSLKELNPASRSTMFFYIVGAVGCGKTTMIRNLRLFSTFEEWGAQPPKEMYRNSRSLTKAEQRRVDDFLKPQMRRKNELMHKAGIGYHVMDRAYLDLIAFSNDDSENAKKLDMLETFVAGDDGFKDGVAILLTADPVVLENSQWARGIAPQRFGGEGFTVEILAQQQKILEAIYVPNRIVARRFGMDAPTTAREVAFEILTHEYNPLSFQERINRIREGMIDALYSVPKRLPDNAKLKKRSRKASKAKKNKVRAV